MKASIKTKVDFSLLARDVMFGGSLGAQADRLEYRKGKVLADVKVAVKKALKAGHAKTEFELSMLEVYLKDVFKTNLKATPCNA